MSTKFSKAEDTSQPHEMQNTLPNSFTAILLVKSSWKGEPLLGWVIYLGYLWGVGKKWHLWGIVEVLHAFYFWSDQTCQKT